MANIFRGGIIREDPARGVLRAGWTFYFDAVAASCALEIVNEMFCSNHFSVAREQVRTVLQSAVRLTSKPI